MGGGVEGGAGGTGDFAASGFDGDDALGGGDDEVADRQRERGGEAGGFDEGANDDGLA